MLTFSASGNNATVNNMYIAMKGYVPLSLIVFQTNGALPTEAKKDHSAH